MNAFEQRRGTFIELAIREWDLQTAVTPLTSTTRRPSSSFATNRSKKPIRSSRFPSIRLPRCCLFLIHQIQHVSNLNSQRVVCSLDLCSKRRRRRCRRRLSNGATPAISNSSFGSLQLIMDDFYLHCSIDQLPFLEINRY